MKIMNKKYNIINTNVDRGIEKGLWINSIRRSIIYGGIRISTREIKVMETSRKWE